MKKKDSEPDGEDSKVQEEYERDKKDTAKKKKKGRKVERSFIHLSA